MMTVEKSRWIIDQTERLNDEMSTRGKEREGGEPHRITTSSSTSPLPASIVTTTSTTLLPTFGTRLPAHLVLSSAAGGLVGASPHLVLPTAPHDSKSSCH